MYYKQKANIGVRPRISSKISLTTLDHIIHSYLASTNPMRKNFGGRQFYKLRTTILTDK
jgi:hypothetical protein